MFAVRVVYSFPNGTRAERFVSRDEEGWFTTSEQGATLFLSEEEAEIVELRFADLPGVTTSVVSV